jgi:hypothetical protein
LTLGENGLFKLLERIEIACDPASFGRPTGMPIGLLRRRWGSSAGRERQAATRSLAGNARRGLGKPDLEPVP